MLQIEILVAPFLETRVLVCAEGFEGALARRVEVLRVLFIPVVRRQIHSAAEPENVALIFSFRDEEADVHVYRGHVRVARMKYERYTERFEAPSCQFRPLGGGRRRQRLADDVREADAAAFEQIAVFDN